MNLIFEKLRTEHPRFIYKSFDLTISDTEVLIKYHFYQSEEIQFFPTIKLNLPAGRVYRNLSPDKLQAAVFNIGMIELISYWKACASPEIIIEAGALTEKQLEFWREIYFQGLGEYLYLNKIAVPREELFQIRVASSKIYQKEEFAFNPGNIIPIGGGKDSVVSIEMLKESADNYCFMLNPVKAAVDTAVIGGFSADRTILVERKLDRRLIELNSQGYLNGHTPFSALLAFVTALSAIIYECPNIALSNENSASEGNVFFNDMNVNHQYSKSFDAERRLHNYIAENICAEINYFSLLRPLHEIQIARLFAKHEKYHALFRSCNKGSKQNIWCCNCSKCLFVYLIISPFLTKDQLFNIFGQNLLENGELLPVLNELTGLGESKPFDCVGTFLEVQVAAALLVKDYNQREETLPPLLAAFDHAFHDRIEELIHTGKTLLTDFNTENLLKPEYAELVRKKYYS